MKTTDFDYFLPDDRIATFPAPHRDGSRLLCLGRRDGAPTHTEFARIGEQLPPRSLLVLNDTRVIPARLRGRKPTGGAIELLLTRRMGDDPDGAVMDWEALGRNLGWAPIGTQLTFDGDDTPDADGAVHKKIGRTREGGGLVAELLTRGDAGAVQVRLRAAPGMTVMQQLEQVGQLPLPPYIELARRRTADPRDAQALDRERYQTVFASTAGAVAAPTAGLHFTEELLRRLEADGHQLARLTLHVGPGTFRPVKAETLDDHQMDAEIYTIAPATAAAVNAARSDGRPIVAVGTTVVRALESAARAGSNSGGGAGLVSAGTTSSRLFLRPGSPFHVVTDLITNFHLPRSTLLMLVAAFAGRERILSAYAEAIASGYRFYSYGDAMLIRGTGRGGV